MDLEEDVSEEEAAGIPEEVVVAVVFCCSFA
jgi:hypothetical protein